MHAERCRRPKNPQKAEQPQPARPTEAALRPKERLALIQAKTEGFIGRQKEKDHNWEDYLDVSNSCISLVRVRLTVIVCLPTYPFVLCLSTVQVHSSF